MKKHNVLSLVKETVELYLRYHISRSAASLSYFLTLSFFPFLLCISWFVGILNLDIQSFLEPLEKIIPGNLLDILSAYLEYVANPSVALLIGGLVLMITASSGAFRAIISTMDEVYERQRRRGILSYLFSRVLSLIFLLTVYISIIVMVTGKWFLDLLERGFGVDTLLIHWQWLRFIVLFFFIFAMLYVLYRFVSPNDRQTRPPVFRTTLLITAVLVAGSILFSLFISLSSRYSLVYGPLASIIIMMLWLYLCSNIILVGAIFNAALYNRKKDRAALITLTTQDKKAPR